MAGETSITEITLPANADLSTNQYRIVGVNTGGSAVVCTTGIDNPAVGVLTNKPAAAGRGARVAIAGIAKCEAGAAIAFGDLIVAVAGGRGSAAAAHPGTAVGTAWIAGIAVKSAAASGDIFEMIVNPYFRVRA